MVELISMKLVLASNFIWHYNFDRRCKNKYNIIHMLCILIHAGLSSALKWTQSLLFIHKMLFLQIKKNMRVVQLINIASICGDTFLYFYIILERKEWEREIYILWISPKVSKRTRQNRLKRSISRALLRDPCAEFEN